jgi:TRAF3-interacting protein 1
LLQLFVSSKHFHHRNSTLIIGLDIAVKRPPDVRVSKILAGQEADKTNLLLQALAEAINLDVDNNEVVRKTLQSVGESNENEEPAANQDQKGQERSERHRSKEERSSKSRERDPEREEPPPPEKKSSSRDASKVKLK